jgi:hypothetical protein
MGEKKNPFGGDGGCYIINDNLERVRVGEESAKPVEIELEDPNTDDASY